MTFMRMLCDTMTLFHQETADGDVWGSSAGYTRTLLTRVRLSQSSGDRAVDARGDSGARQAVLFFVRGASRANGSLDAPSFVSGDRIASGDVAELPSSGVWTVKGVNPISGMNALHHVEVSLV